MAAVENLPSSLSWNFGWVLSGNFAYALSQWAMLAVIARLGNASMVGIFALGLAVTAPIAMLANLQLRSILATDIANEFGFGEYLLLRLLTDRKSVV